MQSILLYSMVLSWWGDAVLTCVEMLGRRGGANFVLKCHALCPICLTFLVVHFYTHIYLSILNLCSVPLSVLQVTVMATPSLAGVSGWSMPAGEKVQPCNHANIFKGTISCDFCWFYDATNHGRPERRIVTSIWFFIIKSSLQNSFFLLFKTYFQEMIKEISEFCVFFISTFLSEYL